MENQCKEFSCELVTMLENIPQNRPLYKDSGLWQVRTDDMEDVIFEQGVNESFFDFIKRVYNVLQLHVCCVKVQNYLSVKHEAERYKTINKLITM